MSTADRRIKREILQSLEDSGQFTQQQCEAIADAILIAIAMYDEELARAVREASEPED